MSKLMVRVCGALLAVMFALVSYGSGVASADPLLGKTYSDASAVASGWNRDVVIETVAGSRLAQADCIVASWRKWDKHDADGNVVKQVLMNLNCNQGLASAGNPGNSLASPEGRQRAKDNVMAAGIAKNDKDCHQSDAAMAWCQALCHRTGLCNEDA